jgi:TolA-binding protein
LVLAAKNDAGGAQALWRQAIEEDAEHALAPACALALAQSLMQSDAAAAKTWCDRVGRDWPKSEYADDAAALQIELLLAERNYDAVAEAVTAFERDHARSGLLSGVRATHARALLEQGQCEQAIALLQPLTQVKSQSQWEWCYLLGLAQLGTKQFEAGLATLSKIPLKPAASGLTDVPVTSAPAASDDLRAAVLAAKGSALVALKRGAEAVAPLKQYLTDYPEGNDAAACRARLCIAYAQSGKLPQARAAWKELAAESEERTLLPTTLYLADEAAKAGDLSLARECLEFAAASDRPAEIRGQALQRLAALAQQVKSPEEAKQIGAVLKLQPKDDALAGVSLAQVQRLEREGQVDAALAAYLQWLKDYPDAGQRPLMLLSAARLHQQEQQNREALALLEEVLEKHADDRLRDAALYQIAGVLADLDRQDDAATHYAELHDKHPESSFWPDATYRLAEHRLRQKQDAEAQGLLSELIEKGKDAEIVAYALLLQGRSAAAAQKWNDVSPPLEQLLTRFPRSELRSISKYWIAESFYRRGKYAEAGRQFAELSTELDDTSEAWAPMVPLRQAQVLAHQQQWQAAHDIAAAIAKKYPTFRQQYEVDYLLGRCLGAQAKFDAAREAYQRVVQSPVGGKTETAAMAQWMIGETYFQEERFDDAISAYHRVERLHAFERWQAAALLQAGKCHETQGHYAEAIQLYAQLLKDHAKTAYAQEASQRLRVAEQRAAKNTKMK